MRGHTWGRNTAPPELSLQGGAIEIIIASVEERCSYRKQRRSDVCLNDEGTQSHRYTDVCGHVQVVLS